MVKVKDRYIGLTIHSDKIGWVKVSKDSAELLTKLGRLELLDGLEDIHNSDPKDELKLKDLRSQAKKLDGYNSKMTRSELKTLIDVNA